MTTYGTADDAPSTDYFSGLAAGYDRFRPGYPADAFAPMTDGLPRPIRAVDVGCGTGIATRMLGHVAEQVIGIEPNEDMIATARSATDISSVSYQTGTAEDTGLNEGDVDLVMCAQAFHWFDAEPALHEFHRILKPGGRLALMWNVRQDADDFSSAYNELMHEAQQRAQEAGRILRKNRDSDPSQTGHFHNVRRMIYDNAVPYSREEFFGRARSASYFPRMGDLRDDFESRLTEMFERSHIDGVVTLKQQTQLTLADRIE